MAKYPTHVQLAATQTPDNFVVFSGHRGKAIEFTIPRRIKFTRATVDALPLQSFGSSRAQRIHWDVDVRGFGLRVGTTDKVYIAQKNLAGSKTPVAVTIGPAGRWGADEARSEARRLLVLMDQGINPNHQKRQKAALAQAKSVTLRNVYESKKTQWKSNTAKQAERMFLGTTNKKGVHRVGAFTGWLDFPVADFTREMIVRKHGELTKKHSGPYADLCMRTLSGVLSHAQTKFSGPNGGPLLERNPVSALKGSWTRLKRRETMIADDDLPKWSKAVHDLRGNSDVNSGEVGADYLEFCLFTGVRRNEAAGLKLENVDLENLTMKFLDTKNGRDHILPVSDHIQRLLERRKKNACGSEWVFPAAWRNKGEGHIAEPRAYTDFIRERTGIKATVHDLRRTFAVTAQRLRIDYVTLKKLMNHKLNDVTGGYLPLAVDDLRPAMQQIADHLKLKLSMALGLKLSSA